MEHIYQLPEASFSKSFRGYDVADVQDYLFRLEEYHQSNQRSRERLETRIAELEKELNRLREAESSMLKAVQLAEEAQINWKQKAEKDAAIALEKVKNDSKSIIGTAEKEAAKIRLLAEGEAKQISLQTHQAIKEQERILLGLQEAQKEIAEQLMGISEKTLLQIKNWSVSQESLPQVNQIEVKATTSRKAPKAVSIQPNKAKKTAKKSPLKIAKAKPGRPKAKSLPKTADAAPVKRGRKPKVNQADQALKPITANKTKPKKKALNPSSLTPDDSLPTLNKVLEAYAKSSGPQGKIGEIN